MMNLNHGCSPYEIYFADGEPMVDAARTLFVGDLSYFCTDQDLIGLFAPFGPVIKAHVRRGVTGDSLMHGFVAVESPESAQIAIQRLNGYEFMGRNIRVQLSSDTSRPNPNAKDVFVQVHVSFISRQTQIIIGEKVLRDVFSPYGAIADVTVKKHTLSVHRQSGYGFVYFVDATAAYQALHSLKQTTIYDITFDCSISHKSEDQLVNKHHTPYYRNGSGSGTPTGSPKHLLVYQQQQQQQQQQQKRAMEGSPIVDGRMIGMPMRSNSGSSTTLAMMSGDSVNYVARERGWSLTSDYDPMNPMTHSPATSTGSIPSMASPSLGMAGRPLMKSKSVPGGASPVISYETSPSGTYHTGPLAYQAIAGYSQPPSGNSSTIQRLLKTNALNRMRSMDAMAIPNPPPSAANYYTTGIPPQIPSPVGTPTGQPQSPFPLAAPQNMPYPNSPHMNPAAMQHRRVLNNYMPPQNVLPSVTNQNATELEDILSNLRIDTRENEVGLPATYAHAGTPTSLHSSPTYRNNVSYSSATTTNSSSTSGSNSNSQYGQFAAPNSPWWDQSIPATMAPMHRNTMGHSFSMNSADYELVQDSNYSPVSLPTTTSSPNHPHHLNPMTSPYQYAQQQQQQPPAYHYQQQQPVSAEMSGFPNMYESGNVPPSHQEYVEQSYMTMQAYQMPTSVYSSNDSSKLSSPTAHFSKLPSPTSANLSKLSSPTASMSTTVSTATVSDTSIATTTYPSCASEGVAITGAEEVN